MLMKPWEHLIEPDQIDVVAPDGTVRCRVAGYYGGDSFTIDDLTVDIQAGDEIRRLLPTGKEEAFQVVDPRFLKDERGQFFGSHYQVKVSRKGVFPKHSGGNYNISLHGANARVNIRSTDNSTNTAIADSLFTGIRHAVENGISDQAQRAHLLGQIEELEKAKDRGSFAKAYQALIASAADHMTILTPFLPALTQMLTQ